MTFGSLYSCVGGADLGLSRTGMRCAFQVEINAARRDVLREHWPGAQQYADVRALPGSLPTVDLLHFEVPRAREEFTDPALRAVARSRPPLVIADMAAGSGRDIYDRTARQLIAAGYEVHCRLARYFSSACEPPDWAVVTSETRTRAVLLAAVTAAPGAHDFSGCLEVAFGPATSCGDEAPMDAEALEVARGLPRGWTRSMPAADRRLAVREATAPAFATWCWLQLLAAFR